MKPTDVKEPKFLSEEQKQMQEEIKERIKNGEPRTASEKYTFNVSIFEKNGKVHISWSTDGLTGNRDWIGLYEGPPPLDPNTGYVWYAWIFGKKAGVFNTEKIWGTNWSAGFVGFNHDTGCYEYYVKTETT